MVFAHMFGNDFEMTDFWRWLDICNYHTSGDAVVRTLPKKAVLGEPVDCGRLPS